MPPPKDPIKREIWKHNISEAKKGKSSWNKGIPCREETKTKISLKNKNKHPTEEQRNKQSLAQTGKPGVNLGKKFSDEWKNHIGEASSKQSLLSRNQQGMALSKSRRGIKFTLEHRLNISNAVIKYQQTHVGKFKDTNIECAIKAELIARNIRFVQQYYVKCAHHLADFFIPETNVIIECDGWRHRYYEKQILRDNIQTILMRNSGYIVYRFDDVACIKHTANSIDVVVYRLLK
jgi:very-short-patch-repair endonuclease